MKSFFQGLFSSTNTPSRTSPPPSTDMNDNQPTTTPTTVPSTDEKDQVETAKPR